MINSTALLAIFLSTALTACGGGGGSGDKAVSQTSGGTSATQGATSAARGTSPTTTGGASSSGAAGNAGSSGIANNSGPATTGTTLTSTSTSSRSTTTTVAQTTTTSLAGMPTDPSTANWSVADLTAASPYSSMTVFSALSLSEDGKVLMDVRGTRFDNQAYIYHNGTVTKLVKDGYAVKAEGMSNHGEVVGRTYIPTFPNLGDERNFIYRDGQFKYLTQDQFEPWKVNDSGLIAGINSHNGESYWPAALYGNGKMTVIDPPAMDGIPKALNDNGQMIGTWGISSVARAFMYSDGSVIDIGKLAPHYPYNSANGINDSGQVVGTMAADWNAPSHMFLYSDGNLTELGLGSANDINNKRQIVGYSNDHKGFIYSAGKYYYLNDLPEIKAKGLWIDWAIAINDRGQILCRSTTNDHFLLLTPTSLR